MSEYLSLINYGAYEGWSIDPFQTLKEAVEYAIANSYGREFKIAKEVDWKPEEQEELK